MAIKVTSVSKYYKNQKALSEVSFSAEKGEVIGFLGPNGAGKSTLMKILTGYIKPDKGTVFVNGVNVLENPIEAKKNIGYLPEHNPLYTEMYVREYLEFQASIFNVNKLEIENCIIKVGLKKEAHKKIGQLSKGYQQRVGIAAAILHNPEVLILDEPTTGLDPNQLKEIRGLIAFLGKDKTVLFSTHIMQEVEAVCNRVIIIKNGKLLVDENLVNLKKNNTQIIVVAFESEVDNQFIQLLPNVVSYKNSMDNTWTITFDSDKDMRPVIFDIAKDNGLKIVGLTEQRKTLETLFSELTN